MRPLLLFGLVLALGCGAAPQRRVAVLGVERANGTLDRAYATWLATRVDRAFEPVAADPIPTVDITERAIRRLAKRVGAAAVVYGELSKKRKGRMRLTIKVHDGSTGALIETHELVIKRGNVDARHEQRFARELLASLPPPAAQGDGMQSVPRPRREPAAREVETDEVGGGAEVEDEPEAEPEPRPERKRSARREPEPEPEFEPAVNATPVRYSRSGQAIDDETPVIPAKR